MANLSETQDALGRKLDEMVSSYVQSSNDDFHMLSSALKEDTSSNSIPAQTLLEETTHVYNMLSLELFRKQSLSQLLFDSMTNDVLTGPKEPIKDAVVSGGTKSKAHIPDQHKTSALRGPSLVDHLKSGVFWFVVLSFVSFRSSDTI